MRIWNRIKSILKAEVKAFQQDLQSYSGTDAFIIVAAPW